MVKRWGTAALALVIAAPFLAAIAVPLAAQEPSLEKAEPVGEATPAPVLEDLPVEEPAAEEPAAEEPAAEEPAAEEPAVEEPAVEEPAASTEPPAEDSAEATTAPLDESFEDPFGFPEEPTIDVTELRAAVAAMLPTTAPPPPIITNILPANTPAAMIVNTRDQAWTELNRYALFAQLSEAFRVGLSPQALPLLPYGVDYVEDVQPWIGDGVAISLLPVPSTRTIDPVERSVTIVPISDAAAFIDFIPTLAEARAALPEQTSYRTFPIWHWPSEFISYEDSWDESWEEFPSAEPELKEFPPVPPPSNLLPSFTPFPSSPSLPFSPRAYRSEPEIPYIYFPNGDYSYDGYTVPGYAVAHLGNYIVMAENIDSLRQWIEYQTQGGPTLTSNPSFEKTQSHPEAANSLATVYGNVGELMNFEFSNPFQNFGLPPIPQPSLSERAAMSALLSNVTFDALVYPQEKGLHLEAHLYTSGALPDLPPSPNADQSILGMIPAATYFMGSGYDIGGFWNDVSSTFSLSEVSGGLIETARSIVSLATGLDLDSDILSWMDGEYSLFLFPSQSGLLNSFFPGVGLEGGVLLETSNREAAETALDALDAVVGEEVALPETLANYPVVNWQYDFNTDGVLDSVLTHTWITEDTLAFTSGSGAMERLVVPAGFNPLDGHSTFINATESFPTPNNGYFYVNMSSTLLFFYNLFGFNQVTDPWATSMRSYLATVRSLSVTTSSNPQEFQIDALLGLAASEPMDPEPEPEISEEEAALEEAVEAEKVEEVIQE